jgi:hypothetical protein
MLRASLNRTMDSLSPGGNPPNLGDVENANVSKARRGSVGENPKPLGSGSGFSLILGALPLAAGCRGMGHHQRSAQNRRQGLCCGPDADGWPNERQL